MRGYDSVVLRISLCSASNCFPDYPYDSANSIENIPDEFDQLRSTLRASNVNQLVLANFAKIVTKMG